MKYKDTPHQRSKMEKEKVMSDHQIQHSDIWIYFRHTGVWCSKKQLEAFLFDAKECLLSTLVFSLNFPAFCFGVLGSYKKMSGYQFPNLEIGIKSMMCWIIPWTFHITPRH
ncbi:uncharacterized protein LOC131219234 [Magnolia sinica]|uniref:uncharacterized protein LOC131219234 n=1 Tax=Magnolia sinica TaxID=86752 RepID=UPI0026590243|nr:uncharacterized protein LOC131219234 [Magnolia sinica]